MNNETKIFEARLLGIRRPMDKLGRIVIPKEMRDYFNLDEDSDIEIYQTSEGILITPVEQMSSK